MQLAEPIHSTRSSRRYRPPLKPEHQGRGGGSRKVRRPNRDNRDVGQPENSEGRETFSERGPMPDQPLIVRAEHPPEIGFALGIETASLPPLDEGHVASPAFSLWLGCGER